MTLQNTNRISSCWTLKQDNLSHQAGREVFEAAKRVREAGYPVAFAWCALPNERLSEVVSDDGTRRSHDIKPLNIQRDDTSNGVMRL